jgi:prepilin-type N-terminal cleavage/methylation domain-containing protein
MVQNNGISKKNMDFKKKQAGFSLFELIVVLAIIGSIVGFIVRQVSSGKEKADIRSAAMKVNTFAQSLKSFMQDTNAASIENGKYATLQAMSSDTPPQGLSGFHGPYLDANYADKGSNLYDPWGGKITYIYMPDTDVVCARVITPKKKALWFADGEQQSETGECATTKTPGVKFVVGQTSDTANSGTMGSF